MSLDRICCIIDMDGFSFKVSDNGVTFRNQFLIRELGYVRVDPEYNFSPKSHHFDLRSFDFSRCTDEGRRTLTFQTERVVRLPIFPTAEEGALDYEQRWDLVRSIYDTCRKPNLDFVAYKGGTCEKNFLKEMNIPHLDLGAYGCPPYKNIIKQKKSYTTTLPRDCGHHIGKKTAISILHCPLAEVTAYRDWLMLNRRSFGEGPSSSGDGHSGMVYSPEDQVTSSSDSD